MSKSVTFSQGELHYITIGNGPEVLLAFHGFGQDAHAMCPFKDVWNKKYTIYSFDLFFHGNSDMDIKREPLLKKEWVELISKFFIQENIEKFSVLGYSMGGRFALATYEAFAEKVNSLYLLAADGVKINFWYHLATAYKPVRKQMFNTIGKPGTFRSLVNMAYKFKLAPKRAIKFAESQMGRKSQRYRVYAAWVKFRNFRFVMRDIGTLIKTNNTDFHIYLGRFDQIINAEAMTYITKYFQEDEYSFLTFNCGHNDVIQYYVRHLKGDDVIYEKPQLIEGQ